VKKRLPLDDDLGVGAATLPEPGSQVRAAKVFHSSVERA
jgi:hypothetical protein